MKYTFEPYRADGSPRKFVGLFRAPYAETDIDALKDPHELWPSRTLLLERWISGRSDRPLYEDDE